jgi:hypothetical protein
VDAPSRQPSSPARQIVMIKKEILGITILP